ncbi:OmpA family protein [Tateyamaria pelophila]|uniref:OmpA family protein n=1 Tax=Tateyamaria pelophila TaxID=328415 RepID=UPI001CBFD6E7|nr:OmpA family protein [Tateyamaria pelophila]
MIKLPLTLALGAAVALGACTDPSSVGGVNDPNRNANRGALIGAASGAALGAVVSGNARGAALGAVVGGAAGAGIGYSLDRQEAELRRDFDNEAVQITNTGDSLIVTLPQEILFASSSYEIQPGMRGDLVVLANSLQNYQGSTVQVTGHTDSSGDAGYNQTLSERRAGAVANVLTSNGVSSTRVQTFGQGENRPIASNLTPEGRALNRRVDVVILPNA